MKSIFAAIYILSGVYVFSSCTPTKSSYYFKTLDKDTTIQGFVNPAFENKILKGDNLGISINSLSQEENAKFNSMVLSGTGVQSVPSYIVSAEGTIKMPRLGEISVAGMTRKELSAKLENDLKPYLKEPIVNVTFLNHKITIMGSVAKPQVLNLADDNLAITDAIALSGDMTVDARRDKVLVIRDSADRKLVKKLNLEDHSVFASSWYYLRPNDIVYVTPNFERIEKEEKRKRTQTTMSLVVSGISLFIIILDRLIR